MDFIFWFVLLFIGIAAALSIKLGKLTIAGGMAGWFVGALVFFGAGFIGLSMLAAFFILGTAATSWGIHKKERLGVVRKEETRRTAGQVLANAGVAATAALLAVVFPDHQSWLLLAMAASFSSATADTLSSELGMLYGTTTYNVVTWQRDKRGENGVVSLEGLLLGVAGSIIIAAIYMVFSVSAYLFFTIVATGTIGNLTDSILGATLERKAYLGNNAVNFLNTLTAALIAVLMYLL